MSHSVLTVQISLPFTSATFFSSSMKSNHVIFFASVKFLIMLVAKFVHFCSLPVIVVVVVVVVVVVLVVVVVVGWYLFIDVSGQPKGKCWTHETWDGWTVSQFGNQLPIFVAQRPRR